MKRVVILDHESDEWSALYLDGKCIDQSHVLGEGDNLLYMLKQSEKHGFSSSDIIQIVAGEQDSAIASREGKFPNNLAKLIDTKINLNEVFQ